jgi:hypothetical protein
MRNFEAVSARVAAGLTVPHPDVVEMFEIVKKGGVGEWVKEMHADFDKLRAELIAATTLTANAEASAQDLLTARDAARAENEALRTDKVALEAGVRDLTTANAALTADNEKATAALTAAAAHIEALDKTIAGLQEPGEAATPQPPPNPPINTVDTPVNPPAPTIASAPAPAKVAAADANSAGDGKQ